MLYITFTNLLLTKATGPSEAGLPRSTIFRSGRTRKLERRPELDRVPVQSLSDKSGQAESWHWLAWLLHRDNQLDAAEDAVSRALDLLPDEGKQLRVCQCHRILGQIYSDKHETKKAIHHYETALGIASSFNWNKELFWSHFLLATLFLDESRFSDTHAHTQRAQSHAVNDSYLLGRAMELQARVWRRERRFEDARSEILRAFDVFERSEAAKDLKRCRALLLDIEGDMNNPVTLGEFL